MSSRVTILRGADGRPEFAVVPWAEYQRLAVADGDPELAADLQAFDAARATGGADLPASYMRRIVAGENPVRVWREFRGLNGVKLAAKSGVSQAYVSKIEQGERVGSARVLRRLAEALNCDLDDLVPRRRRARR